MRLDLVLRFALPWFLALGLQAQGEDPEEAPPEPVQEQGEVEETPAPEPPAEGTPDSETPAENGSEADPTPAPPSEDTSVAGDPPKDSEPPTDDPKQAAAIGTPGAAGASGPLASLSAEEMAAELRALVEAFGDRARLLDLGRSAGGREILGLEIGRGTVEADLRSPALGWFEYESGAHLGGEAALRVGRWLLEQRGSNERVAAVLDRSRLVLLPSLDPDVREGETPAGGVRYGRNFPLGWEPPARGGLGGGDYPLCRPSTLALARFLEQQKDLALVLSTRGPGNQGGRYPGARFPATDQGLLGRIARGEPQLLPWPEFGSGGGDPFDFAYQAHGMLPLAFDALPEGDATEWCESTGRRVLELLDALPRLTLEEVGRVRIGPGLWQLDVAVENAGSLPTLSSLAAEQGRRGRVVLALEGARLVATARRRDAETHYTDGEMPVPLEGAIDVADRLAPKERVELRLFLEAEAGSRLVLRARSPRATDVRREFVLDE